MKLRGDELKRRAGEVGVSVDQLGEALARTGLTGERATRAVRNWIGGRDHPRCKKGDIERLAQAVGCRPADIVSFQSQVRHHRGSPKKAKLVIDLVRGKTLSEAENLLRFSSKRGSVNVWKALEAARADAEDAGADVGSLVVAESRVDRGPHIKRFQPKDRGRAHPILKRTSHITVAVEERS